jgi:hypothetical protein
VIGFLIFAAAAAQTGPAVTVTAPVEKLICKRVEDPSTGSRLGKSRRVCQTATEWRAESDETVRAINDTKDKGLFDPNSKPGGRVATCSFAAANKGRC